jgi:hypothetical protein
MFVVSVFAGSCAKLSKKEKRQDDEQVFMNIMNMPHIHLGTAPPGYHREWVTHTAHCHGFANLSKARDVYVVYSPEFEGLGHRWILQIYPDGDRHAAEGMTSLFLWNMSDKAIEVDYGFSVNDADGKQVVCIDDGDGPVSFGPVGSVNSGKGIHDFALRSELMSATR